MENIDLEESNDLARKKATTAAAAATATTTTNRINGTQFTIPKLLGGAQGLCCESSSSTSLNLNKFLLKQTNQNTESKVGQTNAIATSRFNVPQLRSTTFQIPKLKIEQLTKFTETANSQQDQQKNQQRQQLDDKQINLQNNEKSSRAAAATAATPAEGDNIHIIDLTTALSTTRISNENHKKSGAQRSKAELAPSFDIPFIDCDRKLLPSNEYCGIDISHAKYKHNLVPPSTYGKVLSLKSHSHKIRKEVANARKLPKHHIERFLFDTQSPDDLVIAALNRFTRS